MQSKQKTIKYKKKIFRKKIPAILLLVLGITFFSYSIYNIYFAKPEPFLNPLAKNLSTEEAIIGKELLKNGLDFKKVSFQRDGTYKVFLKDGSEIFLSPKKSILKQVSSLQLIVKRLKIEGKRFKRLDFRYDKPVIVF